MLPKVGQVLYLRIASLDEEEANQEYKVRILDINDSHISIDEPIHVKTGKSKSLSAGDELSINYIPTGGTKSFFNTEVLGFLEDVTRLVLIRTPGPDAITKIQRRTYLRVPAELEVAIRLTEQFRFMALTEDVGGGGVSFVCDGNIPLKSKDMVSCWLLIHFKNGQIEHVPFHGVLVRVQPDETGEQRVMLSYSEIADTDRQKVIRYCFERQLELRKR